MYAFSPVWSYQLNYQRLAMKKIIVPIIAAVATTAMAAPDTAQTPLWLRDAKISPDGSKIAFTYKGDIFTVPTAGGAATRLTSQPTYETAPIWSPDGRTIAFASDVNGNFDIFTVPSDGSASSWKRLTFNSASETPEAFSPDGREVWYSAAVQDPASSIQYPVGRLTEVYAIAADGTGSPRQVLATPARNIAWAPDGRSFVYNDVKGFEDTWRKHHTSSVTRDVWRYTPSTGRHTKIIDAAGEDLDPVVSADSVWFISERGPKKSLNVFCAPLSNPSAAVAVTNFDRHPVRFLSRAANGTLAFAYNGELYTLAPGARRPAKVNVTIAADYPADIETLTSTRGAKGATVSPNGKNVAFAYRGDIYVTSVEYSTTKQITDTPEAEGQVSWANDSTLLFTSERDGRYNIYRATSARGGSESDLTHATVINTERLFPDDRHERTYARMSPDGKKMAFILDRNKLAVKDMESGRVRELTDGSTYLHRNGGFYYTWSPDSKWIALEVIDGRDPYTDVAIINVADGTLTNITQSGYFDSTPRWVLDGNALIFVSERYGMRNHASWGSQSDVMIAFMNQAALDNWRRSKEDRELAEADGISTKRDGDIVVELDGISDRQRRLTPFSTDLHDAVVDADGETLYFISEADDGSFLWEMDMDDLDLDLKKRLSDSAAGFEVTPDGKEIFIFGNSLQTLKGKSISYRATKRLDHDAERRFMFDNAEREVRERFLLADMGGVDWTGLSRDYRRFLPHISNNYDYAELLSEWLGELNVSHTGGRYRGGSDTRVTDRTASLGVLYDMTYTGPGLKIAEILPQGPLYGLTPAVNPGDVVVAVNGVEITTSNPIETLLNEASGKRTLIDIKSGGTTRQIALKPISTARQSALLYKRWVDRNAATVDSLSHGRLGYVHLDGMDDENFRRAYSDLLGKYNDRDGVVVDIRWNGGGRLHEDIEVLLSGQKYFTQEIRGKKSCDMPSRRWNKPSVMLMSEACYSNAHGTPWVYKHRNIGKLVGMPVPGTMSSVNWITMQDPTLVYGVPVIAYRLADGSILENQQLEPDVMVENTPEEVASGIDSQLRQAVQTLLQQIDRQ